MLYHFYVSSPLGEIELSSNENTLLSCTFVELAGKSKTKHPSTPSALFSET